MAEGWIEAIRECKTVGELAALFERLGGASNGPEFVQAFSWRKEELTSGHEKGVGTHRTEFGPAIDRLFAEWTDANLAADEHGRLWAQADAEVKRLQGRKFTEFRAQGKTVSEAEQLVNADEKVFEARLQRNLNESLLKVDYFKRDLLAARWDYLNSLMVNERGAGLDGTPERGR